MIPTIKTANIILNMSVGSLKKAGLISTRRKLLNKGMVNMAIIRAHSIAIKVTDNDSSKNWKINCLFSAPTVFRRLTSSAR